MSNERSSATTTDGAALPGTPEPGLRPELTVVHGSGTSRPRASAAGRARRQRRSWDPAYHADLLHF